MDNCESAAYSKRTIFSSVRLPCCPLGDPSLPHAEFTLVLLQAISCTEPSRIGKRPASTTQVHDDKEICSIFPLQSRNCISGVVKSLVVLSGEIPSSGAVELR